MASLRVANSLIQKPVCAAALKSPAVAALIPDDYLPDVHVRLMIYKRIANATTSSVAQLSVGRPLRLAPGLKLLIRQTELKIAAEMLGIRRIDLGENGGHIEFKNDTQVPATRSSR